MSDNIKFERKDNIFALTGDTLITTREGYKQIKDIEVGDEVLTHKNRYKKVLASQKTGTKEVFNIDATSTCCLKATDNLKFLVRSFKGKQQLTKPTWKQLKDLNNGDYLGMPVNNEEIFPIINGIPFGIFWDNERLIPSPKYKPFWSIVSKYVLDGYCDDEEVVIVCDNDYKVELLESYLRECEFSYFVKQGSVNKNVCILNKAFYSFVSRFGDKLTNKHLTDDVINLPIDYLKIFLESYLEMDVYGFGMNSVFTINKDLAFGLGQCISKVYKIPYSLCLEPLTKQLEDGKKNYEVSWNSETQSDSIYEDGYIWFPVKDIKSCGIEDIYDIEVKGDHSFIANNVIVHDNAFRHNKEGE